jgi:hypothetical protein
MRSMQPRLLATLVVLALFTAGCEAIFVGVREAMWETILVVILVLAAIGFFLGPPAAVKPEGRDPRAPGELT